MATSKLEMSLKMGLSPEYVRQLSPDADTGFVATIHEFPGCIGYGTTSSDALRSLEDSAASWIEATAASGQPIPPPANYENCSGKVALRISRRLHSQAAERADLEGTSLNQLISTAIAKYLATADAKDEIFNLVAGLESRLQYLSLGIPTIDPASYMHYPTTYAEGYGRPIMLNTDSDAVDVRLKLSKESAAASAPVLALPFSMAHKGSYL